VSLFVLSPEIEGRNEVEVGNCETGIVALGLQENLDTDCTDAVLATGSLLLHFLSKISWLVEE
jgi:hypothetical protein